MAAANLLAQEMQVFGGSVTCLFSEHLYAAISLLISDQQGSSTSSAQASATSQTLYTAGLKLKLPQRTCKITEPVKNHSRNADCASTLGLLGAA